MDSPSKSPKRKPLVAVEFQTQVDVATGNCEKRMFIKMYSMHATQGCSRHCQTSFGKTSVASQLYMDEDGVCYPSQARLAKVSIADYGCDLDCHCVLSSLMRPLPAHRAGRLFPLIRVPMQRKEFFPGLSEKDGAGEKMESGLGGQVAKDSDREDATPIADAGQGYFPGEGTRKAASIIEVTVLGNC